LPIGDRRIFDCRFADRQPVDPQSAIGNASIGNRQPPFGTCPAPVELARRPNLNFSHPTPVQCSVDIPHNVVLGDFEQLVLLGVLRLGDDAYGANIRQEIHARSGRDVSINAVYTTLDRLESKGLLRSWTGEPTAQRGGRRRKFYAVKPAGVTAVRHAYHALRSMADGLEGRLDTK
jgi:PadR family transcriptional regulator PadR